MPNDQAKKPEESRLDSWKEIAAFFSRDERTVKRWEKERGLPVHRVPGGSRGTVFAFTDELAAWLRSSRQTAGSPLATGERNNSSDLTPRLPSPDREAPVYSSGQLVTGGALLRWGILTAFVLVIFLGLYGFSRFFQIRSVQGHMLPRISFRRIEPARREAADLYLKGRYHWSKRTPEDLTQAVDYFTAATERDPNFAPAYAGLADCYNLLREYTSMPASQAFPLAIAAAEKAISLDDNLSEGHRALAFAEFHWNWDAEGGEREFRRAIELNPNDAVAHHWYATALLALPRYAEAQAEIDKARQLDPTSRSIAADRAIILFNSGREQEGLAVLLEMEKTDPDFRSPHVYLAEIYQDTRQFSKYIDEMEMLSRLTNDQKKLADASLARARMKHGGDREYLEGLLADQLREFRQGRVDALAIADTYAAMGNKEGSLEYLEKAYRRHESGLRYLQSCRHFRFLKDESAYQNLLQRIDRSAPSGA